VNSGDGSEPLFSPGRGDIRFSIGHRFLSLSSALASIGLKCCEVRLWVVGLRVGAIFFLRFWFGSESVQPCSTITALPNRPA
jgi:hypothetical protein